MKVLNTVGSKLVAVARLIALLIALIALEPSYVSSLKPQATIKCVDLVSDFLLEYNPLVAVEVTQ